MCVIIHKPPKAGLYKKRLRRLWDRNSDGGGFAYIDPGTGELKTYKALTWHEWWPLFRDANDEVGRSTDMIIHMRIATHGKICLENTHPFQVDEHTLMAHNGVFSDYAGWSTATKDGEMSDTRLFIEEVVQNLPSNWLDIPGLRRLFQGYIGSGNKVVFLTNNPKLEAEARVFVFNSNSGTTRDNMWFSNSFGVDEPIKPKTTYNYHRHENEVWNSAKCQWEPKEEKQEPKSLPASSSRGSEDHKPVVTSIAKTIDELAITNNPEELVRLNTRYANLGLLKPISKGDGIWFCLACDEALDASQYYYCACYEKVCVDCYYYASDCICDFSIPRTTIEYEEFKELCIDMFGKEEGSTMTPNMLPDEVQPEPLKRKRETIKRSSIPETKKLELSDEELATAIALGLG